MARYLLIHTAVAGRITVALVHDWLVVAQSAKVFRGRGSTPVLAAVVRLLGRVASPMKISGILVVRGNCRSQPAAGFTQLRAGIVTANALGYGLGLPVGGVFMPEQTTAGGVKFSGRFPRLSRRSQIVPVYSQAPNITRPKMP